MKKTIFTLTLLTTLLFCGCEGTLETKTPPEEPIIRGTGIVDRVFDRQNPAPLHLAPSQNQMAYSQMGADFAQKLFGKLCLAAEPGENVCISPLSLEIALGMLANGVETSACTEMLDIIAGRGVTTDSLNVWYFKLRSALEATNCVRLANALWTQVGYPINPDFIAVNQTYYDAEVGNLDFTKTQQAADSICQWAYDHTYGNIRDLNLPITQQTIAVLANATWFGANWAYPFEEGATTKETFTLTDGTTQTVDMMNRTESFMWGGSRAYSLVELPFGVYEKEESGAEWCVDTPYSMLVALPDSQWSVNDIIPLIDWDFAKERCEVNVHLPKFDFKTTNELKEPMKSLGIEKVFAPYGALTIGGPDLFIKFINQDVSVRIDEAGAEMAAVTTIGVEWESFGGNAIDFNVNRPFVFAVRDNVSHNILFIGKVENIEETKN